jgi:hypothetical protein
MEVFLEILHAISWPVAVLIVLGIFCVPIWRAVARLQTLKATSKGVELVLEQAQLSATSRAELSGLSPHDIWALDDFSTGSIPVVVSQMKLSQRVAARALLDLHLLTIEGSGLNRKVVVTPLGQQILQAAESLL